MSDEKARAPKRRYLSVLDGPMSDIVATTEKGEGASFEDAKKEAIKYLDGMLEEYKDAKRRIRGMVRGDVP